MCAPALGFSGEQGKEFLISLKLNFSGEKSIRKYVRKTIVVSAMKIIGRCARKSWGEVIYLRVVREGL